MAANGLLGRRALALGAPTHPLSRGDRIKDCVGKLASLRDGRNRNRLCDMSQRMEEV